MLCVKLSRRHGIITNTTLGLTLPSLRHKTHIIYLFSYTTKYSIWLLLLSNLKHTNNIFHNFWARYFCNICILIFRNVCLLNRIFRYLNVKNLKSKDNAKVVEERRHIWKISQSRTLKYRNFSLSLGHLRLIHSRPMLHAQTFASTCSSAGKVHQHDHLIHFLQTTHSSLHSECQYGICCLTIISEQRMLFICAYWDLTKMRVYYMHKWWIDLTFYFS